MLRRCVVVTVIVFATSGCSLLQPSTEIRAEPVQNETGHSEAKVTTETTDPESVSSSEDREPRRPSIGETAFAIVFIPVYSTGCFAWWLMNGCPE